MQIADVWRFFHPDIPGYTWRRLCPTPTFSRLDYIFVLEANLQFITEVKIVPGFKSDHSFLKMSFSWNSFNRGSGYWKFNTSLLNDPEYLNRINDLIDVQMSCVSGNIRMQWETLKLAIRGSTLQFAARRKKSNTNKLSVLTKKLARLEDQLLNSGTFFPRYRTANNARKTGIERFK